VAEYLLRVSALSTATIKKPNQKNLTKFEVVALIDRSRPSSRFLPPNQKELIVNPNKLAEFKTLFEKERQNIISQSVVANTEFQLPAEDLADEVDLTSSEMEQNMRIRLRNRQSLYLKKIEQALTRIQEGTFGECQNCDEEIEMKRLEARATTTFCVACKEEQEHKEMLHIDGHKHKSIGQKLRLKLA
jgi:DnaK suppressor protein